MVIAYHLIWTGYGWWLPNDPRGSGSRSVRLPVLRDLGELHYGRKRVQPPGRVVRGFYDDAHLRLKHPVLSFSDEQTRVIADAFAETMRRERYTCYACAIMPDHVHLLIRKHRDRAEAMIETLQRGSRLRLGGDGLVAEDHPVWTNGGWKVFLDTPTDIERTVRYIETNPVKAGRAAQRFAFAAAYDGWPFHKRRAAGH